jgi:Flp pilus assembly protein TadD
MRTWILALALAAACAKKPPVSATDPGTDPGTPPAGTPSVVTPPEEAPRASEDKLSPEEIKRRLADAVGQLTVGSPEAAKRALGILTQIAQKDATNAFVFFNLGVAHAQLGEVAFAERAYKKAIELDPKLGRAYLGLAVLLEKEGRSQEAVTWYQKGAQAVPEDMELRSALIGALRRRGALDEAVAEAKSALALNSKSLPVYNDLGLVYLEKGDLSLADFVYTKAMSIEGGKNNASIRCNYGWVLYQRGEIPQARVQFEEAYKLDAEYLPTLVYLASVFLDDRNYGDASPLLEKALRQEPENYGVLVNLGIAYRGLGKLAEAKAMYEKALVVRPSSPDPYLNLGVLYGDYLKEYPAAIQAFNTYLQKGGSQREQVTAFIAAIEKEQVRAEKKRQQEEERKRREAEKAERERLLREAEHQGGSSPAPGTPPSTSPPEGTPPAGPWGPQ